MQQKMTELDLYHLSDTPFLWDHPQDFLNEATALHVFLPVLEKRKRKMRISSAIEMCLYQQPALQYKSSVNILKLRKKLQKKESF